MVWCNLKILMIFFFGKCWSVLGRVCCWLFGSACTRLRQFTRPPMMLNCAQWRFPSLDFSSDVKRVSIVVRSTSTVSVIKKNCIVLFKCININKAYLLCISNTLKCPNDYIFMAFRTFQFCIVFTIGFYTGPVLGIQLYYNISLQ